MSRRRWTEAEAERLEQWVASWGLMAGGVGYVAYGWLTGRWMVPEWALVFVAGVWLLGKAVVLSVGAWYRIVERVERRLQGGVQQRRWLE